MPSNSAKRAATAITNAKKLRATSSVVNRNNINPTTRQLYLHASLAASVAAWDAYLNNIVREYFSIVALPGNQSFLMMKQISQGFAERSLSKFNTPNFENSRNLIVSCTGYDPYGDWAWTRKQLSVLQVQEKLNQILKVRHSFAHGSIIPQYPWTLSSNGIVRLTNPAVQEVESLLRHLVMSTDIGLRNHIQTTFSITLKW